eukprot:COSAG02_NODE_9473_length_2205_cov_2.125831_5_plen_180_part_00
MLSLLTAAEMCARKALFSACSCTSWSKAPLPPPPPPPPATGEDAGELLLLVLPAVALVSPLFWPKPPKGTLFAPVAAAGDFLEPKARPRPAAGTALAPVSVSVTDDVAAFFAPKLKDGAEDEPEASSLVPLSSAGRFAAVLVGCNLGAGVAEGAASAPGEAEEDFASPPFIKLQAQPVQ